MPALKSLTTASFGEFLANSKFPVSFVCFTAPKSRASMEVLATFCRLSERFGSKASFGVITVDAARPHLELKKHRAIPHISTFLRGKNEKFFEGAPREERLIVWMESILQRAQNFSIPATKPSMSLATPSPAA